MLLLPDLARARASAHEWNSYVQFPHHHTLMLLLLMMMMPSPTMMIEARAQLQGQPAPIRIINSSQQLDTLNPAT
jgi:hypothetical protein